MRNTTTFVDVLTSLGFILYFLSKRQYPLGAVALSFLIMSWMPFGAFFPTEDYSDTHLLQQIPYSRNLRSKKITRNSSHLIIKNVSCFMRNKLKLLDFFMKVQQPLVSPE